MMEVEEDEETDNSVEESGSSDSTQENAQISVSAVSGISDYWTMRVRGLHGKHALFVLIDSGSTHNFIDPTVAAKLKCSLKPSMMTRVTVADGRKLGVVSKVENFKWEFKDTTFEADMMIIPLSGCDVVLGVQWLATLGPITWDFKTLKMRFKWGAKTVQLHGLKQGSIREVKAVKLNKLREEEMQLSMLCAHQIVEEGEVRLCSLETRPIQEVVHTEMEQLVEEFGDIFEEPTHLPPFWLHHNHKIPLMAGSDPINQRPYRYALHQKNEIDKIVK